MKIIGSTMLEVRPMGLTESRRVECFVTDSESHRCILLGRNFMRLFQRITFDFENQRVTFSDKWCTGLHVQNKECVRLTEETVIPARSEKLVAVECLTRNNLVLNDFEQKGIGLHAKQLYAITARVMP